MSCEVGGFCRRVTLTQPGSIKGEGKSTPPSPLAGEGWGEGWPKPPAYFSFLRGEVWHGERLRAEL